MPIVFKLKGAVGGVKFVVYFALFDILNSSIYPLNWLSDVEYGQIPTVKFVKSTRLVRDDEFEFFSTPSTNK